MSEVVGPESPVELGGPSVSMVDLSVATTKEDATEPPKESAPSEAAPPAEVAAESIIREPALEANEEVRDQPTPSGSPVNTPELSPPKLVASISEPTAEMADYSSPPDRRFVSYNRGRVVSLDRGHDLRRVVSLDRGRELLAEMEGMNSSSDLSNAADDAIAAPRSGSYNDDDDDSLGSNSSDGESSYFAKHLPSPKSGRRWSYSDSASISSAPARAGPYANGWKTDTSLSFSDDEDDDHVRPGMKIITSRAPMLPPPVPREGSEELPPYPQRIARIHSMNSLVSSSSDGEGSAQDMPRPPPRKSSTGSLSSVGDGSDSTSSDPSVRAELRHVAVPTQRSASTGAPPMSGRMPPVSGAHYPPAFMGGFMHTPPTVPQGSPPPMYQGQVPPPNVQNMAHPQPMTQEQMATWLAAGNNMPPPAFMPSPFFPPPGYGATATMPHSEVMQPRLTGPASDAVNSSGHSTESGNMTLTMVYSEDEDADEAHYGEKMAMHAAAVDYHRSSSRGISLDETMSSRSALHGGDVFEGNRDPREADVYGADAQAALKASSGSQDPLSSGGESGRDASSDNKGFKVYPARWLMLMYMSVLNLLSDWTCYSVAPISLLTSEAFGKINPEQLVVVFLGANAVATACEPIILSRLGLRRTVLLGAFLLMLGSIVKSGGLPPIVQPTLTKGQGEWRVYLGFFLVGLSQPLYQCTPALLSASWFPESERTMATGVALNANQLGIGFAFIFGTLLVATSDDIVRYFGLLSFISTVTFVGTLVQFDDAPPTPPSDTARAIRGTFQPKMHPAVDSIWKSVRSLGASTREVGEEPSSRERSDSNHSGSRKSQSSSGQVSSRSGDGQRRRRRSRSSRSGKKTRRSSSRSKTSSESPRPTSRKQAQPAGATTTGSGTSTRRRSNAASRKKTASTESGLIPAPALAQPPSPASTTLPTHASFDIAAFEQEAYNASVIPPSQMVPGPVGPLAASNRSEDESPNAALQEDQVRQSDTNEAPEGQGLPQHADPYIQYPGYQQPQWQQPYWDPRYQQPHFQHPGYQQQYQGYYQQQGYPPHGYYGYPQGYYPQMHSQYDPYNYQYAGIPPNTSDIDEGAEPTVTVTPHHLDIHIRDDQIILSAKACLSRPGFPHALVAFTVSGIVINTLSTFMDYLVRLNGAGREYTGIVGGSFQFVIMISSLVVGKQTDRTRAYYSVILGMLVMGAFALAECGVSLDADRGSNLRWTLIVVAALVGPLQPVSTELGVDVAYPLSENTVLVIQQLFSNLLSAMFIPFFKALKDVGTEETDDADVAERPEYTFSFYLLIVLHAMATVFFATFNGRYLRYEQEMVKKAQEETKMMFAGGPTAFHPVQDFDNMRPHDPFDDYDEAARHANESQPLMNTVV